MNTPPEFKRRLTVGHTTKGTPCYVDIEFRRGVKGVELSICGEIPYRKDDFEAGTGGQCREVVRGIAKPAYSRADLFRLYELWERWHMNGLRAGCEHQRALGWKTCPGHYTQKSARRVESDGYFEPLFSNLKGKADITNCAGQSETITGDVYIGSDFYHGSLRCSFDVLSKPCPTCGYKYGSAWMFEEIPAEVIEEIKMWPEKKP